MKSKKEKTAPAGVWILSLGLIGIGLVLINPGFSFVIAGVILIWGYYE